MSCVCVLVGLAVMSVDFGNEFMKIAIVKVSTCCWDLIVDVYFIMTVKLLLFLLC